MATDLKTWTIGLFNVTGSALAGPAGGLIGSLTGGLVAALLSASSSRSNELFDRSVPEALDHTARGLFERRSLFERLDPIEKRHINHDLQTAFRDALRESIYDIGGEHCFPQVWSEKPRQAPAGLIYLNTPPGEALWQAGDPLAEQVGKFFKEMLNAMAEQRLLPLEPPLERPAARKYPLYPEAGIPQALMEAFFYQVILLPLHSFDKLIGALPEFEANLRHYLINRAFVHLGGMLKSRLPAWSAYNLLALDALASKIRRIDPEQDDILAALDYLLETDAEGNQPSAGGLALAQWADGLAELLAATGRIEKQADESFAAVLASLDEQQEEALQRINGLMAEREYSEGSAQTPQEEKLDDAAGANGRALSWLEDGSYTIEGAPPAGLDELPQPGDPPYRGLRPFSSTDADLFFGREQLIASLAARLRPASSARKGQQSGGNFLALTGASGCGKSSLVCAGLIPALCRGQPLADGTRPPAGSKHWPVYFITPGEHPLQALSESLARDDRAIVPDTLVELMRVDVRSLNRQVKKLVRPRLWQPPDKKKQARDHKERILLVVDQFEELFTRCREEAERKAFIDNLMTAVDDRSSALVLIIVLRADSYTCCANYERLRQAVASCQEYIGDLTPREKRRTIEEPARRNGWELENGLAKEILRDLGTGSRSYSLPALSHAMLETWKHRRGKMMTLESYAESGGIDGAIAKTAETAYQQLDARQQVLAREILLQLTVHRTPIDKLALTPEDNPAVETVLNSLAEAGLITIGSGYAEIAHEALLDGWPALQTWLGEEHASQDIHRQVSADARDWQRLNNDPAMAYRGARLAHALEWAEGHTYLISPLEAEFLEFSKITAEREATGLAAYPAASRPDETAPAHAQSVDLEMAGLQRIADEERRHLVDQAARRHRMRSLLSAGLTALVILAAVLALVFAGLSRRGQLLAERNASTAVQEQAAAQAGSTQAVSAQTTAQAQARRRATAEAQALEQKSTAQAAQAEAQRQSSIALARELAALSASFASTDSDLSLLLAAKAAGLSAASGQTPVVEAQNALFQALQNANYTSVLRGHTGEVQSAEFSPDGKRVLTTGKDGTARLWDLANLGSIVLRSYTGAITSAAFSPDGSNILTAGFDQGQDGVAELWDLNGARIAALTGHTGPVNGGCFSPDGALIATAGQDKTARLWKKDGSLVAVLSGHSGAVTAVVFSPDRTRLITLSEDATARLWSADGAALATLSGHSGPVLGASFTTDSSRILTAGADGSARVWLADGSPQITLDGHGGAVYSAVFSKDGQRILTASEDGSARLWSADGKLIKIFAGLSGSASTGDLSSSKSMAIYSPDGTYILTAGGADPARLWRSDGTLISSLSGHNAAVYTARFSADSQQIVTASADRTARVWNISSLHAPVLVQSESALAWAGFSPDGKQVLAAGQDGVARLYGLDGTLQVEFKGHKEGLSGACFSPDGKLIATASRDGTARIWRTDGASLVVLQGHTGPVNSVSFSPDSKMVVTAGEDGTARLYYISGSLILSLAGHTGPVWSASFSPDGKLILTAGQDGTARIWNSENGQLQQTIDNSQAPVNMAAFSPEGLRVITAGQDGIARLWKDGEPLFSLEGTAGAITWAALSPDDRLIVTTSSEGSVRLWTSEGKFIASLGGSTQEIASANFSPDGKLLVTASRDGTVRVWNVFEGLEAMQTEAIRRAGRTLTEAECQQYLHQDSCQPGP